MRRVYFLKTKKRDMFFENVKESSKESWRKISLKLNTTRSMLEKYRKGKLLIPEDRFSTLLTLLPEPKRDFFLNSIKIKERNWGQVIGGKKAYEINKEAFDKGREKVNRSSKKIKYEFDINMLLSEGLCEFIGFIIGDGFTNKYGTLYQTQLVGDKELDAEYYHKRLGPLCEELFNISPKIKERPDRIFLNIYSKRLFEMLTKRFNIPAGKKSYTVVIPKEILNSNELLINATLRGMFNADGGIGFDKRKTYKKPYIRINYTSASRILIDQISEILSRYSINHSTHKKNYGSISMIQINGQTHVSKFIKHIGFSNPRHTIKLKNLTS